LGAREAVAENLRRFREEKGWTQEHLSGRSGVVQTTIGRIERVEMNPSLEVLEHLAIALDVSVSTLVASPEEEVTPSLATELASVSKDLERLQGQIDRLRTHRQARRKK
jgi:transcriptional regulator with XRE-family HTH domain